MNNELTSRVEQRVKELGRFDLWPILRVEMNSLIEQSLDGEYLAAADRGDKCENTCNSWVAWVLGICDDEPSGPMTMTNVPGLADIDSDFDKDRRDEVVEMTCGQFGHDNVAHIGTYGQYRIKLTVQTVLKHRGIDPQTAVDISKEIPYDAKTLDDALGQNERLASYLRQHPEDREVIEGIVGAYNNVGMHAAGVVISPDPIHERLPMTCTNRGLVTAMDMDDVQGMGLVKFDFLGLANVTTVARCLDLVRRRRGIDVDLTSIPMRVEECSTSEERDLLRLCIRKFDRGEVDTIFQFETPGFFDVLGQMEVRSFDDLVAIMSLNRPGAKKFISRNYYERYRKKFPDDKGLADPEVSPIGTYAENRAHPSNITAPHPDLTPILRETYGIPVYQEQALRIVQVLSGATLAEADTLRRAIGKKKGDLFQKCHVRFEEGCRKRDVDEGVVQSVWKLLEEFDRYSFNKAHSCAYATLSFWNMYLRQRFTAEWYAAVMTTEFSQGSSKKNMVEIQKAKLYSRGRDPRKTLLDGTKLGWYRQGAKDNGVEVIEPNVNLSEFRDAVIIDDTTVVLPLSRHMNIGSNAEPVSVGKPYEDIADMATRANAPESVLKTLVEAGACNEMIDTRRGTDEGVRALKSVFVQMRESERAAQARLRKTQTTPDTGGLFDFEPTSGIGIRRALQKMDDDLAESRSAKGKSKGGKTGGKSAPKSKLEWQ